MPQEPLTVVVPAYNEEAALPTFLPRLIHCCERNDWKLIVVNDGSEDRTAEILGAFGHVERLRVLHHKVNRGYGGALRSGRSDGGGADERPPPARSASRARFNASEISPIVGAPARRETGGMSLLLRGGSDGNFTPVPNKKTGGCPPGKIHRHQEGPRGHFKSRAPSRIGGRGAGAFEDEPGFTRSSIRALHVNTPTVSIRRRPRRQT